jgi:integrase
VFPDHDVKNRVSLDFPLDVRTTELIDDYIHRFRPTLLRGRNEDWLFPGEERGPKQPRTMSQQVTELLKRRIGVHLTPHQFRHAAAALMLKHQPGNYEWVRRVLGHKTIQTTVNSYIGLETAQATERFGALVHEQLALYGDQSEVAP